MIVVKIEMWPQGSKQLAFEIGRMVISNKGNRPAGDRRGDYRVRLLRKNSGRVQRTCEINNYPRKSTPVWELVRRSLNKLYE